MRFLGAEATPQANEESAAPKPWGSPHRLSAHQIQAEPAEQARRKNHSRFLATFPPGDRPLAMNSTLQFRPLGIA
jgi:hypothetical protein